MCNIRKSGLLLLCSAQITVTCPKMFIPGFDQFKIHEGSFLFFKITFLAAVVKKQGWKDNVQEAWGPHTHAQTQTHNSIICAEGLCVCMLDIGGLVCAWSRNVNNSPLKKKKKFWRRGSACCRSMPGRPVRLPKPWRKCLQRFEATQEQIGASGLRQINDTTGCKRNK